MEAKVEIVFPQLLVYLTFETGYLNKPEAHYLGNTDWPERPPHNLRLACVWLPVQEFLTLATMPCSSWVLGIRTQVLLLTCKHVA